MKNSIKLRTVLLIILLFISILSVLTSQIGLAATESTVPKSVTEDFENDLYEGYWTHSDKFSRSTTWKKAGSYSFKASGPDGKVRDGAQYRLGFADGKIEAWVYPKTSSYHRFALWLRASEIDLDSDPVFQYGYCLELTNYYLALYDYG